jgi:hypothetical protein
VEAVVPPLGVCGCSSGRSPRSQLCLGTGGSPRSAPVVPSAGGAASTARWTCPIEAAAKGIGLKFVNEERQDDGPKEEAIMLWRTGKSQFAGGRCALSCTWRKTRSSSGGSTCISTRYGSREVHRRRWLQIPWILRNCPTFSAAPKAAPRIRVSLNTMRVKFASAIR